LSTASAAGKWINRPDIEAAAINRLRRMAFAPVQWRCLQYPVRASAKLKG
jgi:hypothetical protein